MLDCLEAHPVDGTEGRVPHDGATQTAIKSSETSFCAVDSSHQTPHTLRLRGTAGGRAAAAAAAAAEASEGSGAHKL